MLILTLSSSFLQAANLTFSNIDHIILSLVTDLKHREKFSQVCLNSQDQRIQMALKGMPKADL